MRGVRAALRFLPSSPGPYRIASCATAEPVMWIDVTSE